MLPADKQSQVYFDAKGEKVLNAVGYDKSGTVESVSIFSYWKDDTGTARREDKNIRMIEQYAAKASIVSALDSHFGTLVPTPAAQASNEYPASSMLPADKQSQVYFDAKGEKVLNAVGYDKSGTVESVSIFSYWKDDTGTARREDKNIRMIEQYAAKASIVSALDSHFGTLIPTPAAQASNEYPASSMLPADKQSQVYFDA